MSKGKRCLMDRLAGDKQYHPAEERLAPESISRDVGESLLFIQLHRLDRRRTPLLAPARRPSSGARRLRPRTSRASRRYPRDNLPQSCRKNLVQINWLTAYRAPLRLMAWLIALAPS